MPFSQKIFFVFIFFLTGVGLASAGAGFVGVILFSGAASCAAFLIAVVLLRPAWRWIALLVWFACAGAIYYDARLMRVYAHAPVYRIPTMLSGTVASHPRLSSTVRQFVLKTDTGARVNVVVGPFQAVTYGDALMLSGSVEPLSSTTQYLKKDRVAGTLAFPSIEKRVPAGWSARGALYKISDALSGVYARIFPPDEAALAAGIVLGQQSASFSASFKEAMRASGTTHIVALSGYNIMIMISAVSFLLGFLFRRHGQFWGSCALVLVFVLMTGAESSVVRAALMGALALIAQYASRLYDFWHSAAAVAFVMVVVNPFVLMFDLGFILSFLSFFGIMIIAPRIFSMVTISKERHPIAREAWNTLAQTIGAQMAVLPVLLAVFNGFSLVSVAANVPILLVMPLAMALVFAVGCVGLAWFPAASVLAIIPHVILWFQTHLILFFGSLPLAQVRFPWYATVVYYGILLLAVRAFPSQNEEAIIHYV